MWEGGGTPLLAAVVLAPSLTSLTCKEGGDKALKEERCCLARPAAEQVVFMATWPLGQLPGPQGPDSEHQGQHQTLEGGPALKRWGGCRGLRRRRENSCGQPQQCEEPELRAWESTMFPSLKFLECSLGCFQSGFPFSWNPRQDSLFVSRLRNTKEPAITSCVGGEGARPKGGLWGQAGA